MTPPLFNNIRACVFDAYGTLFDVHSAVDRYEDRVGKQAKAVSELWRMKQLQYTWIRSLMGKHAPFWQLTGDALDYALEAYGISDASLRDNLMSAYLELDAYPEVSDTLSRLKDMGMKLAILSNGSPQMLESGAASAGIAGLLDANLSVEEVGIYKPDPRVYQLAGVTKEQVSFQSSNSWDAVGAATFGFRVAWINRFGQGRERLTADPDVELKTLDELLPIVGAGTANPK